MKYSISQALYFICNKYITNPSFKNLQDCALYVNETENEYASA